ncbi:RecQ1-like protein [Daphnia pulex]|uniref:ATP-dependent DNA helicase n=1 Tax=Daphnia pulex TaxID=6669 RepID=E9G2Y5_DAPPU|nr:RecQ1-like protein [Daphnia pulex]|eukprot:EFX86121.1 RecQ1-like protein [Daphnia pulex]
MAQLPVEKELNKIDAELRIVEEDIDKLQERKTTLLKRKQALKEKANEEATKKLASQDWESNDFPWTKKLYQTLKDAFHIEKFRPMQLSAMNATLKGHDVILIMPTGGGKSLCYQLPALVSDGITLVITPLVSLMEDQLASLEKLGIEAAKLNASSSKEEVNMVHLAMTDAKSSLKLLYVTPEKLAKSKRFMTKLQKMYQIKRFACVAVDEVHCCSQWGHDFRPDYKYLGVLRSLFPTVPIVGLTATATLNVTNDVQKMLNMKNSLVFKASFNRPNLYYEVRIKPSTQKECIDELVQLLTNRFHGQSGIIYTTSVKDCDQLASELRQQKCRVASYHASLEPADRTEVHTGWRENRYQAVVATIAFGMGIDKPDVRFVIHHSISKSMENFYQESGRAGRDDLQACCIVYWRLSDLFRLSTMVFTEQTGLRNLYAMAAYCLDPERCRREIIASHFDERWESSSCNKMCDHCSKDSTSAEINIVEHLTTLRQILERAEEQQVRVTAQKLIDAWQNTGQVSLRLPDFKKAAKLPRDKCESILAHFLLEGYLKEDFHFTPYSTISYLLLGERAHFINKEITMKVEASSVDEAEKASSSRGKTTRKQSTTHSAAAKKSKVEDCLIDVSDSD